MGLRILGSALWEVYSYALPEPPNVMAQRLMRFLEKNGYEIVEIKKEGAPITGTPVASQEPTTSSSLPSS